MLNPHVLFPRLNLGSAGAICVSLGVFLFACSSATSRGGFDETPKDGVTPIGPGLPSDQEEAGTLTGGCSADLQSTIDSTGKVVACPPDQGCANGKCVPACDAAAESKGSLGCKYTVATPGFYTGYTSPCFAVFVANAWGEPAKVDVERDGKTYDVTEFGRIAEPGQPETSWDPVPASGIPAGKVAVLFLQAGSVGSGSGGRDSCPVTPAFTGATGLVTSGRGKAWSITSNVPVTAYDIMPYGGASSYLPSAELLIPSTAWGTNYLAIVPPSGKTTSLSGEQWGQIVAAEDNTTVTIASKSALPAGTNVPAVSPSTPTEITLNAGEFVQWLGGTDMSGSVIQSDKPVAFNGGHTYLCYSSKTSTGGGCDSGHQQVPPISALGSEYAIVPYQSRNGAATMWSESIRYRIVGAVDGTDLTYDPPISGAPTSLGTGQVVDFEATAGFVVKSQDASHPFFIAQTMSGCLLNGSGTLGDEEYVNVLPPKQFLNGYLFFTDPTYKTTNLVVTRVKTADGFNDVEIDCLGKLSGWKPIGTSDTYEATTVDLLRNGSGKCQNGPHTMKSQGPVGITVWGLDYYASYAYPAGGSIATINAVVVPPVPR
jgi:hypothetical protein